MKELNRIDIAELELKAGYICNDIIEDQPIMVDRESFEALIFVYKDFLDLGKGEPDTIEKLEERITELEDEILTLEGKIKNARDALE